MAGSTKPTPKKRRPLSWKKRFLAALRETGLVGLSAERANIDRTTVYDHRKRYPAFAKEWDEALEAATDDLVNEARRRALHGVTKGIYHQGERVDEVLEYSDTLLMFLVKKERPAYRDPKIVATFPDGTPPRIDVPKTDDRSEPSDPN